MTNNYQTYEALDFAQDDSFIRWVKGRDDTARQFWEKWRDQHPEKTGALEAGRRLVLALQVDEQEPSAQQVDDLWSKIDRATPVVQRRNAKRIPMRLVLQFVAAASVALLIFLTLFDPHKRVSSGNEQILYNLPDGSSVNLNESSMIVFKKKKWNQDRTIQLEGEAFFSVTKGSPFTVNTLKGQVKVLGTSFNIKVSGTEFEVNCLSGRVSVNHGDSKQLLTARQSTRLQNNGTLTAPVSTSSPGIAKWRDVEIVMNSAKLSDLFDEMERQFGISVISTIENDQRLVNAFFRNSNLDSALYNIDYAVSNIAFDIAESRDTVFVTESEF